MKRISQYLMLTGLTGLVCLFLAVPADAQRGGGHGGGGGGGNRGGGGGSFSGGGGHSGGGGGGFSRGGGGGFSRGGATFNGGGNRSTNSFNAPRQSFQSGGNTRGFNNRGGNVVGGTRGTNSFNGRTGVNAYRGAGVSGYRGAGIRGGFTRNGRYYAGGYSRGFGARYSPWYNRGGYYYNRGLYRSAYYSRLGFGLSVLPFGYYPFYWGADQFFYSGGYFYQYNNDQYTVVEPPIGAAINSLPEGAQSIMINGDQYYELNGVYYVPITKDDGSIVYQVAGKDGQLDTGDQGQGQDTGYAPADNGNYAPANTGRGGNNSNEKSVASPEIGDIFYTLPPDTRKIKINSEQYYVSPDDFYYQESRDQENKKVYKVVGTPDQAPGN